MIKHSFSPKMCRKNFENRFTNKNLMSKMLLNRDSTWAREIIQKSLALDSSKFVNFIQMFEPLVSFSYNLVLVSCIFNIIWEILIFSGKIVTSPANNFSMQKSLFRNGR